MSASEKAATAHSSKMMPFAFGHGEKRFNRQLTVGKFSKLDASLRLRLAVGMANSGPYAFLNEDLGGRDEADISLSRKAKFVLTIFNKGQAQPATYEEMSEVIGVESELGRIAINGNGPELTELGYDDLVANINAKKIH